MAIWLAWLMVIFSVAAAFIFWWEYRTGRRRTMPIAVLLGFASVALGGVVLALFH
jgi:hypothetical protein